MALEYRSLNPLPFFCSFSYSPPTIEKQKKVAVEVVLRAQSDGNLVLYGVDSQKNINLGTVYWNSGTWEVGSAPYRLVLQNNGNLVYFDATDTIVWQTSTSVDPTTTS